MESCCRPSSIASVIAGSRIGCSISKIELRTAIPPIVQINFVHLLIPVHIAFDLMVGIEAFLIEILVCNALIKRLRLLGMRIGCVRLSHLVALRFLFERFLLLSQAHRSPHAVLDCQVKMLRLTF